MVIKDKPIPLVDLKAQYLSIKQEIDASIQQILDNTSFIMGKPLEQFEKNLAGFCGCKHAVGVSSGTSALFLALKTYELQPGDEVITVPNSFIATAEAIIHCGATPVFVDVDEKTMLMDVNKIEEKINAKTKGIIPVHLYGQVGEMDTILVIAQKHNLFVLEDAAQSIDAEYKGRKLPIGETAIFSFFPAKNLGGYGDGGAVVTNNLEIAKNVAKLRDHGRINKYEHDLIGYGERLDALQAAILDVKLKYLNNWTMKRREHAYKYNNLLDNIKNVVLPVEHNLAKHVYYMYVVRARERDQLISFLKSKGIASGIHYPIPLHLQPALKYLGYRIGDFPVAEKAAMEIISLPMFPELNDEEIKFICNHVKDFYEQSTENNNELKK